MDQTHYKSHRLAGIGKDCWAYFSVKRPKRAAVFIHGWNGSAVDTWMQFQSMLQGQRKCADTDLLFFGYHSWRRSVGASAASLFSFLKLLALSPQELNRWPKGRGASFSYREFILVAHSLGAIVSRRCLLTAFEKQSSWANSCRLVLYAPAHFGGNPLKLIPKSIKPAMEVLWPTLDSLKENSPLIQLLESETKSALRTGKADFLRAEKVVHGSADTVVCRHGDRFCEDAVSEWIEDADHTRVCKPNPDFQPPFGGAVSLKRRNFEDIKQEFYWDRTSHRASLLLKERGRDDLLVLLRHHREKPIKTRETWERDYFDYLLSYYSILEIALLVGFVDALPPTDVNQAIAELSHPAVRAYYEIHYKVPLPSRLLRRLLAGEGTRITDREGLVIGLFMEFMTLTTFLETDDDMETFLWFLDGGSREGYWYKDTVRVLKSSKRLAESMSKKPKRKDALDRSVEGFTKFLNFCVQLDALVTASRKWPEFQSAMLEYHSYWFVRLREKVKDKLNRGLEAYAEVTGGDADSAAVFDRVHSAVNRLLSPKGSVEAR